MDFWLIGELAVTGALVGLMYALVALGIVLVYKTSGVANFAQGAIAMLGAFLYWQLRFDWGVPAPIAVALVVLVAAPLFGAALDRVLMRKIVDSPLVVQIVVERALHHRGGGPGGRNAAQRVPQPREREDHRAAADDSAPGASPVDSLRGRVGAARQDSRDERHQPEGQAEKRSTDNNIRPKRN